MLFTGRQTRWDVLTWDVLTLGRFDFRHFDLGHFHLRRFDSGTFWLWDVLTWDVLTLGRFGLGRFDSGTFWLGTFWLWDVLTWDDLTLGHFDQCVHKKCLLARVWLNIVKIYLGRFDSPKMGRFGKSLGTFWFWDILTGYRYKHPLRLVSMYSVSYTVSAQSSSLYYLVSHFVYIFLTFGVFPFPHIIQLCISCIHLVGRLFPLHLCIH